MAKQHKVIHLRVSPETMKRLKLLAKNGKRSIVLSVVWLIEKQLAEMDGKK